MPGRGRELNFGTIGGRRYLPSTSEQRNIFIREESLSQHTTLNNVETNSVTKLKLNKGNSAQGGKRG
jgi:hypothetical protein